MTFSPISPLMVTSLLCSTLMSYGQGPGFVTDYIQISSGGGATDTQINTTTEALAIYNASVSLGDGQTGSVNVGSAVYNVVEVVRGHTSPNINFGNQVATFSGNDDWPSQDAIIGGSDFLARTTSSLIIPAGTWQIAFGSDDGAFIKLPGINFSNEFNENGGTSGDDTIFYNPPRGHAWTGGTITLASDTTVLLEALVFERGGGDTLEIAIRDASAGSISSVNSTNWDLLENGQLGWNVTQPIPEPTSLALCALTALVGLARRSRI